MDRFMLKESVLIEQIINGDNDAFRKMISKYQGLVSHIVYRMIDNSADREDLCQDIFVKAYKNLKNFRKESKLSTWIGRIAFNTCSNYLKKLKAPLYDDLAGEDETIEDFFSDGVTPEEFTHKSETSGIIENAINRLPVHYKTAITLYHIDSLTYDQIGEIMNMPEGTVKSHLFRARKLLKGILMKSLEHEGMEKWSI
jgi:RNA polymerase sigma-70 factor (ECF subfamily)